MVERNEKGKQARQYFIDCEKKARQLAQSNSVVANRKHTTPKPSITTKAKRYLNMAKEMIDIIPGLKPELAIAHALDQIRVSTAEDVSQIMRALPSVNTGYEIRWKESVIYVLL